MKASGVAVERLLFALLVVLHLLPLWLFPCFPSQDGPSHQGVAAILRQLDGRGENAPSPQLLEVFSRNRAAVPNAFVFWLLERDFGFDSIAQGEKLLLTLYVLLLPLSLRFAVLAIDRKVAFLSWLGFPFIYNDLLHMGFYNFCFSLAAFLFTLGAYLRWRERMTPARTLGLTLLVTWVYFCHPVTLVSTVAVLGTIALCDLWLELRSKAGSHEGGLVRPVVRHLVPPLVASLPALALMVHFIHARGGPVIAGPSFAIRAKQLLGLYSLASLDRRTALLAAGTAALLLSLAALVLLERWRGGRRQLASSLGEPGERVPPALAAGWRRGGKSLLAAVAVLLAAYFLAPNQLVGGGYVVHRLNLLPYLLLILALATREHTRRRRVAVPLVAAALSLGFLALFARAYSKLDDGLVEIAATAPAIERGRTLLFLSYAHQGLDEAGEPLVFRTQPYVHAGSAVAAASGAVDLSLYEANEDYFPVIYRRTVNPYTHLSTSFLGIEGEPPRVDLEAYTARTGVPVDYVLLWGWRQQRAAREPDSARLARQLAAGYEEIERSPEGNVRLYRRLDRRGAIPRGVLRERAGSELKRAVLSRRER